MSASHNSGLLIEEHTCVLHLSVNVGEPGSFCILYTQLPVVSKVPLVTQRVDVLFLRTA